MSNTQHFGPAGFRYQTKSPSGSPNIMHQSPNTTVNRSVTSARKKSTPNPVSAQTAMIEDSYIKNLQQQVQFLELEVELQKKLNSEQQRKLFQNAQPLDETVDTLRMTFIQKDKEYQVQIEDLRRDNEILRKQLLTEKKNVERVRRDSEMQADRSTREYNARARDLRQEIIKLEKRIEELENENELNTERVRRLTEENNELRSLNSEYNQAENNRKEEMRELRLQLDKAKEELEDYKNKTERQLKKAEENVKQFDNFDRELKGLQSSMDEEVSKNQKLEFQLKQTELERDQLKVAKEKAEEVCKVHMDKCIHIQGQMAEQLKKLKQQEAQCTNLQATISKMESSYAIMKEEQNDRHRRNREYEKKIATLEEALAAQNKKANDQDNIIANHDDEVTHLKEQLQQKEYTYQKMNEQNEKIRIANRNSQDNIAELNHKIKTQQEDMEKLRMEILDLQATIEQMERKLKLANILELLKDFDFNSMLKTNQAIAERIQDLVTFLPEATSSLEEKERREPLSLRSGSRQRQNALEELNE